MVVHQKNHSLTITEADLADMEKSLRELSAAFVPIMQAQNLSAEDQEDWEGTRKWHALSHVTNQIRCRGAPSECRPCLELISCHILTLFTHCQGTTALTFGKLITPK
jgi:hypothetical protein